jgi:acyl carrier protein phosphodiesterase
MRTQNWLCSYREVSGIALALSRLGARLRRPVDLGDSVSVLEQHYDVFRRDFRAFFPELVSRVSASYKVSALIDPSKTALQLT